MTAIQIRIPADPGTTFGPTAFEAMLGEQTAMLGVGLSGTAKITAVEVIEDGAAALVTLDGGDLLAGHFDELSRGGFSFGFNPIGQIETHAAWANPGDDRG